MSDEHTMNAEQKMGMLDPIRRMSLRTRLGVLAAFALLALVVALFVAWRLARTTETFALRQADASLHAAARDLAREFRAHPSGYQTIEDVVTEPGRPPVPRDKEQRERPLPPHIKTLFAAYTDPLSRLAAITLHRYPEIGGGFYRAADNALAGRASASNAGTGGDASLTSDTTEVIRTLAREASETRAAAARTIQQGDDRIIVVAYPAREAESLDDVSSQPDAGLSNSITAVWTLQRLSNITGVSDAANWAALAGLILSIVLVSGLAFVTVRDLRSGVTGIERGLTELTNDLTQQVKAPLTPELARITVAINQLAETLRLNLARQSELEHDLQRSERLSALGRLVAGVAHEVRNPLAAIKLKVQMARRVRNAAEGLDKTFRVVTEEIDRLDALVHRLLEFGRTQPLALSRLDICALVRRRVALFSDVAERASVKIEIRASQDAVMIEGDAERLAQVIDNLIQNALDAMPEGGRLAIRCEPATSEEGSATARLSVEDTGRGIPAEDRERIFEPFFTSRASGTGLGLAISREIVAAHEGRISFVSRDGQGALFQIELPKIKAATMRDEG